MVSKRKNNSILTADDKFCHLFQVGDEADNKFY
jgi:hypothetical protein